MKSLFSIALFGCLFAVSLCLAAPKARLAPGPEIWTLDLKYEHPQQILVKFKGENRARRFWYIILTLTNNTGEDVEFYPKCDLLTDTFKIVPASCPVSDIVFNAVKRRHGRKYPFLESLEQTGNRILQGEDNAKDLVIIWPEFDPTAKKVAFFIAGLSNETVVVEHPTEKGEDGKPLNIFLRKTLELDYAFAGDPTIRNKAKLMFQEQSWVLR